MINAPPSKKKKKSGRGRRITKRKKEMHPEIKESLKLSAKGSLLDDFIFIFFLQKVCNTSELNVNK
jgi:hypothetical protein